MRQTDLDFTEARPQPSKAYTVPWFHTARWFVIIIFFLTREITVFVPVFKFYITVLLFPEIDELKFHSKILNQPGRFSLKIEFKISFKYEQNLKKKW